VDPGQREVLDIKGPALDLQLEGIQIDLNLVEQELSKTWSISRDHLCISEMMAEGLVSFLTHQPRRGFEYTFKPLKI
jgi:hypothetical protein